MTDKKETRISKKTEAERIYRSYAADFSKLDELSDMSVTNKSASKAKTSSMTDDDLFDADCGNFETDDYDDTDAIVIPADIFNENTEEENKSFVQPDISAEKTKTRTPADIEKEKPAAQASERNDISVVKPKSEITRHDIKPASDSAIAASKISAVPSMSSRGTVARSETTSKITSKTSSEKIKRKKRTEISAKTVKSEKNTRETPPASDAGKDGRPKKAARPAHESNRAVGGSAPYSSLQGSVWSISLDFLPALLPILIWAVFVYGIRVLMISAVSVLSCVIFELWFEYLIRKRVTVSDLSAVSDGLLIALLMPASVPLWIPIVASFFGTVIIKCLFGGRGRNILQPSLAGFALVALIFRDSVTSFTKPLMRLPLGGLSDSTMSEFSSAYPLSAVSGQNLTDLSYTDMIIGLRAGSIGEISILLLAVTLIYMLIRRVVTWHVPVSFIAVSGVLFYLLPRNPVIGKFTAVELFCGMIPLCAILFAADFTVSPIFGMSKIIYGAGCGACAVLFRYLGLGIHSAVYAVLIMNLLARPLDMLFVPRPRRKKASE